MEVKLSVGNPPKSMTGRELNILFVRAGDVTDRRNGAPKGYAFVCLNVQSESDKAVNVFNTFSLDDHLLEVALVKPGERRGFGMTY